MDTTIFIIILLATVMHAIWNAMVKHHPDKVIAVLAIVLGHIPLSLFCIIYFPLPGKEALPYIVASVIAHQGYQWYMINSYKIGDYTNVYPIFRGFGPLLATLISIIFLGVVFKITTLISILFICFGIMVLGLFGSKNRNQIEIIKYALMTGSFISLYSLIDGYGARVSTSAISYISFSFLFSALLFPVILKLNKHENIFSRVFKDAKIIFWVGGSLSFIIYVIVVWGFTKAPIPIVSALRETSIFFSIFIGYFFLKETVNLKKIISILLIVIGVVGIKLF
ncbi:EamA family transporter [Candidatus Pelagibacter sp.]|nr:EamA family transporter [Candidatus Pelagibacter sp.]